MPRPKSVMTPRWETVLEFIRAYIKIHGVSPSYTVMAKSFGMKSKSNMHRIVQRLKQEGHLDIRKHKYHGVKLVDKTVEEVLSL